jgi:hypothetical protein
MPRFLLNSAGMRVSLKNGVPSSGTCPNYNPSAKFALP